MRELVRYRYETYQLVESYYRTLRLSRLSKARAFELENDLSTQILDSEQALLTAKARNDKRLVPAYSERRLLLKRIADGLAWRFLGHDEHFLNVYATGKSPGYMAGKSGYVSERRVVQAVKGLSIIRFAIQNDITNILRIGDVASLLKNNEIVITEVKSSEVAVASWKTKRQAKRADTFLKYLYDGQVNEIATLKEPEPTVAVEIKRQVRKYYWLELEQIISRTLENGFAWQVLDEGVLILGHVVGIDDNIYKNAFQQAFEDAKWVDASVRFGALSRHFDTLDADSLRFVIPFTAFNIAVSSGLAIICGDVEVIVIVNINVVVDKLTSLGYKTEVSPDSEISILPGDQTGIEKVTVASGLWNDLIYGLLKLPMFIDEVTASVVGIEKNITEIMSNLAIMEDEDTVSGESRG